MHLLVETNFLLEIVLEQEQAFACEQLLLAAEQQKFRLHIPSFSLMEQLFKLGELSKKRGELQQQVQAELLQAERKNDDQPALKRLKREFATVLTERNVRQQEQLVVLGQRVSAVANLVCLEEATWIRVAKLTETTGLTLPDAVVAASLMLRIEALADEEMLFVTRDSKGFNQEDVRQLFQSRGCELLFSFEHACQRLRVSNNIQS